ncbi:MAG: hypothetical protein ACPGGN_02635 [Opitutales bacterium]
MKIRPLFYLSIAVLCLGFGANKVIQYHRLEKKIIPVEIPIPLVAGSTVEVISNNFHSTGYMTQVAFWEGAADTYIRHPSGRLLGLLGTSGTDSSIRVFIEDANGQLLRDKVYSLREFTKSYGFAFRYLEHGYSALSVEKGRRIPFETDQDYRIVVETLSLDPEIAALEPKLIFFGVDDGYWGIGYFLYPVFFTILFLVVSAIFALLDLTVILLRRIMHKKPKPVEGERS